MVINSTIYVYNLQIQMKKNSNRRYRMDNATAKKIGAKLNKSGRYMISKEQEKKFIAIKK